MFLNFTRIKNLLSRTAVSYAVVVLSFLARGIQIVFFYNIRVDASYQVMATDNLLHGHGISTAQVLATDLSQVVYTPLTQWPPGYSLLLAPFYALFNHHYIVAGITLDLLAALMLLLFCRRLLLLLRTPLYLVNLFTLLYGFFIYFFYFIASSDAIAISFFVAGIYFFFALLKSPQPNTGYAAGLTLSLFVAGLIKYLFIPVVLVVPFFMALYGFFNQRRQMVRTGSISFLLLFLSLGGFILYFKSLSGSVAYISAPERGWFPKHLTEIYPFLTASFIKPDTPALIFGDSTLPFFYRLSQCLTLLLVLFASVMFYRQLKRKRNDSTLLADTFFLLLFCLSLAVTGVLMVLSLFVAKEEILPGWFWTYVEEPRYYGLINILVHLGVAVFYQYVRSTTKRGVKAVFMLMLLLLLPELLRGVFFDFNRIKKFGSEEYSWQYEKRLQDYADRLITGIRQQHNNVPVVITGPQYYYNHRIVLASHVPVLYDSLSINNLRSLHTTKPVVVLVKLHKNMVPRYSAFLQQHGQEPIGTFEDFYFYAVAVKPD